MDAWKITKDLKKHSVRCVLGPVYGEKNSENRYRDPIAGSVLEGLQMLEMKQGY